MMTNNTLQKIKKYLEAKEKMSQEEEQLLNDINENLAYFPCISIHRDTIKQAGFITDKLDDETMEAIAKKLEERLETKLWISIKSVCGDMPDVYKINHDFCPECKKGNTWFNSHSMTFYCDDCYHEFINFDGMIFTQPLTKVFLKDKLEPFFEKYVPDFDKICESVAEYAKYSRYEVFQKGRRNSCVTIYQDNGNTYTLSTLNVTISVHNV